MTVSIEGQHRQEYHKNSYTFLFKGNNKIKSEYKMMII